MPRLLNKAYEDAMKQSQRPGVIGSPSRPTVEPPMQGAQPAPPLDQAKAPDLGRDFNKDGAVDKMDDIFAVQNIYNPKGSAYDEKAARDWLLSRGVKLASDEEERPRAWNDRTPRFSTGIKYGLALQGELAKFNKEKEAETKATNEALYAKMGKDIEGMKSGKEGIVRGLMQPKIRVGREGIADKLQSLKSYFGSRGGLMSGQARKAAAEARVSGNKDLVSQEFDTRNQVDDSISELENLYQTAGLNMSGVRADAQFQNQLAAIKKRQDELNNMAGMGQALGQVGGIYLGSRKAAPEDAYKAGQSNIKAV